MYDGNAAYGHIELLIFQATTFCNIDCSYCYLPLRHKKTRIDAALVRSTCDRVIADGLIGGGISVVWHAGEPLVIPAEDWPTLLDACAPLTGAAQHIVHCFQTNGTLIDDGFIELFKRKDVRVCVSIDGPKDLHDACRKDRAGRGTFDRTMAGIDKLRDAGIPFDTISVATSRSAGRAEEIYEFLADLGARHAGFNMDEAEGTNTASSWDPDDLDRFRDFFSSLFAHHMRRMRIRVREFDAIIGSLKHLERSRINQQSRPFGILTVGADGTFSPFAPELLSQTSPRHGPLWAGNVNSGSLTEQFENWSSRATVASEVAAGVKRCSETCELFALCGGGSPSNKYFETGGFDVAQTNYCRFTKQAVYEGFVDAYRALSVER
jgi:uncharacterized protein